MAGDVVIADNFSLLHGREGFRNRSTRHLQRVHIQGSPACVNHRLRFPDRTIADAECL
jgi:L-tyrosine isonitrile desaturase/decarboxylase